MILPLECPKCGESLERNKVLPESTANYSQAYSHWSRVQVVVVDGKAQGFQCPFCSHNWEIPWMAKPPPEAQDLG